MNDDADTPWIYVWCGDCTRNDDEADADLMPCACALGTCGTVQHRVHCVHRVSVSLCAPPGPYAADENRHGDFFTAVLKARPEFVNDFESKLWVGGWDSRSRGPTPCPCLCPALVPLCMVTCPNRHRSVWWY